MGTNKDTKIFYQFNVSDAGFKGTITGTGDNKRYSFRNQEDTADVVKRDVVAVWDAIKSEHTGNGVHSRLETYFNYKTFSSVAEAKSSIINDIIITEFNTHCEKQQWALVDSNRGLKMTRNWKVYGQWPDASKRSAYDHFEEAADYRWYSLEYLKLGGVIVDNEVHLF